MSTYGMYDPAIGRHVRYPEFVLFDKRASRDVLARGTRRYCKDFLERMEQVWMRSGRLGGFQLGYFRVMSSELYDDYLYHLEMFGYEAAREIFL